MPTVLRAGRYRVDFYSHDSNEPPQVHVDRADRTAKFWLKPVSLSRNLAFKPKESRLVESEAELRAAWREHLAEEPREHEHV